METTRPSLATPSGKRVPAPTGTWVLAAMAPALAFIASGLQPDNQTDFWHHLSWGRSIVTQGRIVSTDEFTCAVYGKRLLNANWLTQVSYYGIFEWGGFPWIQFVNSLALAGMMALFVFLCRRASGSLLLATVLGVFTFFAMRQLFVIRPQTFSFLLFMLLYAILDLADGRPWLLVLPPVIMALWVNMHGAFPAGFLLLGSFGLAAAWDGWRASGWKALAERRVWCLGSCLAASLLATLVNPYGLEIYQFVDTTVSSASSRHIQEWLPPGLDLFIGKMWVASVLLVLVSFALPGRRPSARDVCLVLCFFPLSCGAVRMVGWWLLATGPIVAAQLSPVLPRSWLPGAEPERPSVISGVLFGGLLVSAALCVPGLSRLNPFPALVGRIHRTEEDLENIAVYLRQSGQKPGALYSRFEWGEYLAWSLTPDGYRVFVDGRIDIYPDDVWNDYLAVTNGRWDALRILDRYQVSYVILDDDYGDQQQNLLPLLRDSGQWEERFASEKARLFVRVPGRPGKSKS